MVKAKEKMVMGGERNILQTYQKVNGTYLSAKDARDAGVARPFRIVLVWDGALGGDDANMCKPGATTYTDRAGQHECLPENVFTKAKQEVANATVQYAIDWARRTMMLNPAIDGITVNANSNFPFIRPRTYPDADQVIFLTM